MSGVCCSVRAASAKFKLNPAESGDWPALAFIPYTRLTTTTLAYSHHIMSDPTWPPSLKCAGRFCYAHTGTDPVRAFYREWVGKCLGQMTDSNRLEAQAEMKKVINQAFLASSLWTTDWASIKLDAYVSGLPGHARFR